MRLARVRTRSSGVWLARLEDAEAVLLAQESSHVAADALREALADGLDLAGPGDRVALEGVALLAPVGRPSKVVGVGLNYTDHAAEAGLALPSVPLVFFKAPSAILAPGEPIRLPSKHFTQVDYEVELAVVIGTRLAGAVPDPLTHVLGYTIGNDVSARDAQFAEVQVGRAKSFDTFCPLGPWIVTADEVDPAAGLGIGTTINCQRLQDGSTADMVFSVSEILRYLGETITLEAGDVILTGTPAGVGVCRTPQLFLAAGDEVCCWIEGIGSLTNAVHQPMRSHGG